jgi:hypothetical protein
MPREMARDAERESAGPWGRSRGGAEKSAGARDRLLERFRFPCSQRGQVLDYQFSRCRHVCVKHIGNRAGKLIIQDLTPLAWYLSKPHEPFSFATRKRKRL